MDFINKQQEQTQTYYDILEISQDSSSKEIKEAFVKLSKQYHPDTSEDPKHAHEKFIKISEAYNVLSKDRSKYNEYLRRKEMEQMFDGDSRAAASFEHFQKYGFKRGPDPRKYSHFYQFYNTKNYQYDPPTPKIDTGLKNRVLLGLSLIVVVGFVMNFFTVRKIAQYRYSNTKKQSEINSIMSSYNQNQINLHGKSEALDKLFSNEIKNMSIAEATAEYERRHREDK